MHLEMPMQEFDALVQQATLRLMRLVAKNKFWPTLLSRIPKNPITHIPTMRLRWDLRYMFGATLEYNPLYVTKISDKKLEFSLAHEGAHLALRHMARWQNFRRHNPQLSIQEMSSFQIAADLAVNSLIIRTLFPEEYTNGDRTDGSGGIHSPVVLQFIHDELPGEYFPHKFNFPEGLSLEAYFRLLVCVPNLFKVTITEAPKAVTPVVVEGAPTPAASPSPTVKPAVDVRESTKGAKAHGYYGGGRRPGSYDANSDIAYQTAPVEFIEQIEITLYADATKPQGWALDNYEYSDIATQFSHTTERGSSAGHTWDSPPNEGVGYEDDEDKFSTHRPMANAAEIKNITIKPIPREIPSNAFEPETGTTAEYLSNQQLRREVCRVQTKTFGESAGHISMILNLAWVVPEVVLPWTGLLAQSIRKGRATEIQASNAIWNRRLIHLRKHGILPIPGYTRSAPSWKIAVILDTSGSMSDEQLKEGIAAILGLKAYDKKLEVHVAYADTIVHLMYEAKTMEDIRKHPVMGRGGTDFRGPIATVLESLKPDHLVYITDGHGEAPVMKPPVPLEWILVGTGYAIPAPYGRVVSSTLSRVLR